MSSLQNYFNECLQNLYYIETTLAAKLADMSVNAVNEDAQKAFENHSKETEGQVQRLKEICEALGINTEGPSTSSFTSMIDEADIKLEKYSDEVDMVLLSKALVVEHHEMGEYMALEAMAEQLNLDEEVRDKLKENRQQEEKAAELVRNLLRGKGNNILGI